MLAADALGKASIDMYDSNEIRNIAEELWWRLTDTRIVARSAFHSLMQFANHLTVLKINELNVIDPLSESTHEKSKSRAKLP